MRLRYLLVLYLAFFISLVAAMCAGSASAFVPAIATDDKSGEHVGRLVLASIKIIQGDGDIYTVTTPTVGLTTQTSASTAIKYAFLKSGRDLRECDVLVKIDKRYVPNYVDGPSGGVAFSILTYAALNNLTIPTDVTFTGGVDEKGNVINVGGIYEKAKLAVQNNIRYFLLPVNGPKERILLKQLENKYNIKFFEIEKIDEAIDFVFYNKPIKEKNFELTKKKLPDLAQRNESGVEKFETIATSMIELENSTINTLPQTTSEFKQLKEFFTASLRDQKILLDKGYLFTAANDAFLNYIDAATFAALNDIEHLDLMKKKKEIDECLNSLEDFNKTDENFEYLVGADIRKSWALTKLNEINISKNYFVEEKYATFNNLMYADAWCHVSKMLREAANNSGEAINESIFKELAETKLNEAESLNLTDDLNFHLSATKLLFENGKYGGAIYDSVFIIKTAEATNDLAVFSQQDLDSAIEKLRNANRSSLWAKLYQAHGEFLLQEDNSNKALAYKVLKFAEGLDEVTKEMKDLIKSNKGNASNSQEEKKGGVGALNPVLCLSAVILIVILLTLPIYYFIQRKNKK
jgi:predicted S18 family serine protease